MNFKSTETRELQDMYRRTLAASFAAQAGELPADECIESIFAGGDGWRDKHEVNPVNIPSSRHRRGDSHSRSSHKRNRSQDGPPGSPHLGNRSSSHNLHSHQRQSSRESLSSFFHRKKTNSSTSLSASVSTLMTSSHHEDGGGGGGGAPGSGGRSPIPPSPSGMDLNAGQYGQQQEERERKGALREVDELDIREDLRSWTLPISG